MIHKQILILALCVVPALTCMHRCRDESELANAARKLLRRIPQPPTLSPASASSAPAACPVELYQSGRADTNVRSISPWRHVQVTNENYFPSTYVVAECLCTGCILIGKNHTAHESHDYNSHAVEQTRLFLERVACGNNTYSLRLVSVKVPVGCTCVRPQM